MRDATRVCLWGVGTALVAFVPILVGLLTANPSPTRLVWVLGIIGGVVAGLFGGAQARVNALEKNALKAEKNAFERKAVELAQTTDLLEARVRELDKEKNELQLSRSRTASALSQAGLLIYMLTRYRTEQQLNQLLEYYLRALHGALSERGRLSVYFLQYHGGPRRGLPLPTPLGGRTMVYSVRRSVGDIGEVDQWSIFEGTTEAELAANVLDGKAPFPRGLVVDDVQASGWQELGAILQNGAVNGDVKSYCRAPITIDTQYLGFLCVDGTTADIVQRSEYEEVITPFAHSIAGGFAVYYSLGV
jgi:hypothetical protein